MEVSTRFRGLVSEVKGREEGARKDRVGVLDEEREIGDS